MGQNVLTQTPIIIIKFIYWLHCVNCADCIRYQWNQYMYICNHVDIILMNVCYICSVWCTFEWNDIEIVQQRKTRHFVVVGCQNHHFRIIFFCCNIYSCVPCINMIHAMTEGKLVRWCGMVAKVKWLRLAYEFIQMCVRDRLLLMRVFKLGWL